MSTRTGISFLDATLLLAQEICVSFIVSTVRPASSWWYTGTIFLTLGDDETLSEVEHVMSSHYTIKVRAVLGAGRDDAKEVRILNQYVRRNSDGARSWIEYERDPRHAELIGRLLNLESAEE